MNWDRFQTYNDSPTRAFEAMCDQLFCMWCRQTYRDEIALMYTINGSGGDGGVEALTTLKNGSCVGLQAKWFRQAMDDSQIKQIQKSVKTALELHPKMSKYIICIPRDLSSQKIGKNRKPIKNSERDKWQQMKTKLGQDFPACELMLWGEYELTCLLQNKSAAGMVRYWFENAEIADELFRYSFQRQEKGWLSQKYVPQLHIDGFISDEIEQFIGSDAHHVSLIKNIELLRTICQNFIAENDRYKNFNTELAEESDLNREIESSRQNVENFLGKILNIREAILRDSFENLHLGDSIGSIACHRLVAELDRVESSETWAHTKALRDAANKLSNFDVRSLFDSLKKLTYSFLLFLGEPGTGKTHGIAHVAARLLETQPHIPILIRAKDYDPTQGWNCIFAQALGLSREWGELEIWDALESLAFRCDVSVSNDQENRYVKSKILICIDGVDEVSSYDSWLDKFRETAVISARNPRIKFCATCRPYVVRGLDWDNSVLANRIYLPREGDVPVSNLYPAYIQHYQIQDAGCAWTRWALKTPFALRLFCDLYRGSNIASLTKSSVTITRLLEDMIRKIEEEFVAKNGLSWSKKELIVRKALFGLSEQFISKSAVEREDVLQKMSSIPVLQDHREFCGLLLDYFEDYGIVSSIEYKPTKPLSASMIKYSLGIQPFFDYLVALNITENMERPDNIVIQSNLLRSEGALQMLSIILLEDYGYLISNNASARSLLSPRNLFELACFALTSVSSDAAGKYATHVQTAMRQGSQVLRQIVNSIIIPVARIEDHPFSPNILHDYLQTFPSPAQRDLVWSIPDGLSYDSPWFVESLNIFDERYRLTKEDTYLGMPLLFAWLLTNADNNIRNKARRELMMWAIDVPNEYWKLFQKVICTNDPQMSEDLFSIAMGVIFTGDKNEPYMSFFRDWLLKNIFGPLKIEENYDVAIRYYSHSMAERLYFLGLLDEESIKQCRPPYTTSRLLPIAEEALAGTRMGGYGRIDYDLSRYVLCDPLEQMFFSVLWKDNENKDDTKKNDYAKSFAKKEIESLLNDSRTKLVDSCRVSLVNALDEQIEQEKKLQIFQQTRAKAAETLSNPEVSATIRRDSHKYWSKQPPQKMPQKAEQLLAKYCRDYKLTSLNYDQFVIALAYSYVLEMGWNEEQFVGNPKAGDPHEVVGVDIAIVRRYWSASQGAMSGVMSFVEKYVWCARNEIMGFLADRLSFIDGDRYLTRLDDYALMTDFPNPAQEVYENPMENDKDEDNCFLPEEEIIAAGTTTTSLKAWINESPVPDFAKWLKPTCVASTQLMSDMLTLDGYGSFSNIIDGSTLVWISSGIISKRHFGLFQKDVKCERQNVLRQIGNPEDFYSSTLAHCYLTPREICWMNWKKRYRDIMNCVTIVDGDFAEYDIHKCVEQCVANYHELGDVFYRLPSSKIRDYLEIYDGNGRQYWNIQNQLVAQVVNGGEKWGDSQRFLLVDGGELQSKLSKQDMQLFWLMRLLRQPTPRGLELHPDAREWRNHCWLVWEEKGSWKSLQYKNDMIP